MARSACCLGVSVLLALAVTATATSSAMLRELQQQDKRTVPGDAHMAQEATHLLGVEVAPVASIWAAKEDTPAARPLEEGKLSLSGRVATQGDDQSSSSGGGSNGNEHGKEEGSSKEGEKQGKSCLTKEECHKKKLLCGKGCTLSAHSKCAAKCSKSCVPTC